MNDNEILFNFYSTKDVDDLARLCAALQCHQVKFTVTRDSNWLCLTINS
jgi:hypothetical protein